MVQNKFEHEIPSYSKGLPQASHTTPFRAIPRPQNSIRRPRHYSDTLKRGLRRRRRHHLVLGPSTNDRKCAIRDQVFFLSGEHIVS